MAERVLHDKPLEYGPTGRECCTGVRREELPERVNLPAAILRVIPYNLALEYLTERGYTESDLLAFCALFEEGGETVSETVRFKNASETLRVERTEYLGKDLVAVRVFTGAPGDQLARPTRKGLTLRPATWREVLPAILAALEEAEHDGARHSTVDQN